MGNFANFIVRNFVVILGAPIVSTVQFTKMNGRKLSRPDPYSVDLAAKLSNFGVNFAVDFWVYFSPPVSP